MKTAQTAVIHRLCSDHSEAIAAYRFFNNDNVPMETLQEALVDPIQPQVEGLFGWTNLNRAHWNAEIKRRN